MKQIGIYKITSPSGKIYIGQSINLVKRHNSYKTLDCKLQTRLYRSLKKYGFENHIFEIIENCKEVDLNIRERYWQDHYKVIDANGLNCVLQKIDGYSGTRCEETRLRISNANKGKIRSDEHKSNLSKALKGRIIDDEWRKNMSLVKLGTKMTNTAKSKMIENRSNTLLILDVSTGIFFDTLSEAANAYNLNYKVLYRKVNGQRKNNTNLIRV